MLGRRAQEEEREQRILRAAIAELALSDYGGMTFESVALRAGVNKTTVYRKWETKAELIRAALSSVFEMFRVGPSVGDLRSDLRRLGEKIVAFTKSSEGKSLMRLRLLEHPEPELAAIAKRLVRDQHGEVGQLVEADIARGEIAPDVDILLLLDMLWGAVYARMVMRNERVDAALIERCIDILMVAAQAKAARVPGKPARRRKT
jgi:AcrR family transcriptional regulator